MSVVKHTVRVAHTHTHTTHTKNTIIYANSQQGQLTAELKRLQLRAADNNVAESKADAHNAQRHALDASEALKRLEKAHAVLQRDRDSLRSLLDTFASDEPSDKEKVWQQRVSTCSCDTKLHNSGFAPPARVPTRQTFIHTYVHTRHEHITYPMS